jgi:quinol monooxygenase YgiN
MVMFSLNHASGSLQEKAFLRDARTLQGLPGVENFEVLRQVGEDAPYRFALAMAFADAGALDAYLRNPRHAKFMRERWDREVAEYLAFDCEPI